MSNKLKILLLLVLLLCFTIPITLGQLEGCLESNCDCFEDFGETEYQCPSRGSKKKLIIHREESKILRFECWNVEMLDSLLPNFVSAIHSKRIFISDCPITSRAGMILDLQNSTELRIENSHFKQSSGMNFLSLPMNHLIHLSLKNSTFDKDLNLTSVHAPNLRSIELENIAENHVKHLINGQKSLKEVNLNFNSIPRITNETFGNLEDLENLILSSNSISEVDVGAFGYLKNLKNLQLDFNDIEYFIDETFGNLEQLKYIDLSNNILKVANGKLFQPLKSINLIYLDFNEDLVLEENVFANLTQLEVLSLGHCRLRFLPKTMFKGSNNLIRISLENNLLTDIPQESFRGLSKLKFLLLQDNQLTKLDTDTFKSLTKLTFLNLDGNFLVKLDSGLLKPLVNLKELNLNRNNISIVKGDSFRYNQLLETIRISNNSYSYKVFEGHYLSISPFSSCLNLRDLDLSYNLVEDVLEDLFVYTKLLKTLNLKGNLIRRIDVTSLWKIARKGISLNLENNNIQRIDYSPYNFQMNPSSGEVYGNSDEDSKILISHNPLHCDCHLSNFLRLIRKMSTSDDFGMSFGFDELQCQSPESSKGKALYELDSATLFCPLESVSDIACVNSTNCKCFWRPHDLTIIIDCANSSLTQIPNLLMPQNNFHNQTEVHLENNLLEGGPEEGMGFETVERLYLSGNRISDINWIPENLDILDLRSNNFQNLKDETLEMFKNSSISKLFLEDNPWRCDCSSSDLIRFIREFFENVDSKSIKCYGQETLLINLTEANVCKNRTIPLMVAASASSLFISLIFIAVAIYYKYRQQIKVWMYSRNLCLSFIEEEELDKDKIFDVFVSYSHKDEDFVINELIPKLEKGPLPYKVCLHFRDWLPGDLITSNIVHSVINSKRTIIILTPNFLESVWGKMEFKTAHSQAMSEKRNRVILILKDKINEDALDEELKAYIRSNTYLKWSDPWFWNNLRFALPHKRAMVDAVGGKPIDIV